MERGHTVADLFCGCGGLALGFKLAGFRSVFAVDNDPASAKTYEVNFGHHVICDDIERVSDGMMPKVDAVIGGPPCQGFSPLGKMSASEVAKANHVTLNRLWKHFVRLLASSGAKAFAVENVPEFLRSREYTRFVREAEGLGFSVASGVLKADDYGVPQRRRRGFILGSRMGTPFLPAPSGARRTVRDAIWDLPRRPTGLDWHVGRNARPMSIERYKTIPPGGNRFDLMRKRPDITPACWINKKTGTTDVLGRLEWDRPSLTIRTEFFKPEKGRYLHPEAHRVITHREAMRLQTFPDDFAWHGTKIQVAKMIGNAVPPLLAKAVASSLRASLVKPIPVPA